MRAAARGPTRNVTRRRGTWSNPPAMRVHGVMLVSALLATGGMASACSSSAETGGTGMRGTEGRERWVVTFADPAPDASEYRALLRSNPDDAQAYAERIRKQLVRAHVPLETALQSFNGRVVEVWWMSNAVTVEVEPNAVPTLRTTAGVASVVPDAVLGD